VCQTLPRHPLRDLSCYTKVPARRPWPLMPHGRQSFPRADPTGHFFEVRDPWPRAEKLITTNKSLITTNKTTMYAPPPRLWRTKALVRHKAVADLKLANMYFPHKEALFSFF